MTSDMQDPGIMTARTLDVMPAPTQDCTVPTLDSMNVETQDRLHDIADVIEFCKRNNFPADVVGRWVWIKFDQKPDQDTRDLLKASGFRWVQARMQWAHNCGYYTRKGTANPRWKYGEIPVSEITRDDLRVLKGVA
jgi:hypothetical protein